MLYGVFGLPRRQLFNILTGLESTGKSCNFFSLLCVESTGSFNINISDDSGKDLNFIAFNKICEGYYIYRFNAL